jgi:hypothetical protein
MLVVLETLVVQQHLVSASLFVLQKIVRSDREKLGPCTASSSHTKSEPEHTNREGECAGLTARRAEIQLSSRRIGPYRCEGSTSNAHA